VTIGDILEEQVDLFHWDDVAYILRCLQMTKRQADYFVVDSRRAAAIPRINSGVDLNP